jgi:hypothetical protein
MTPNKAKGKERFRVIPYPLTADIRIRNKEKEKYNKDTENVVDEIRHYGSKVIARLYLEPKEKRKDPYFNLLYFIHLHIEGREEIAKYYENLKPIENPIIF